MNQLGSTAGVRVGGSSGVTVSHSVLEYGVELDAGTSGTVSSANVIASSPLDNMGGEFPAVRATDATGTVVESNTINPIFCARGIGLAGVAPADNLIRAVQGRFWKSARVA